MIRRILLSLFLWGGAQAAGASLIHDLTVTSDNFNGTGTIVFNTLSGNDLLGIDEFSFTGTRYQQSIAFGRDAIGAVAWSIDDEWNLSLGLLTEYETGPVSTAVDFALALAITSPVAISFTPTATTNCLVPGEIRVQSGETVASISRCPERSDGINTVLIASSITADARLEANAPEPATTGLFALGLGLIAASARKRCKAAKPA